MVRGEDLKCCPPPLISVILPTYNREKYLRRAIDSVLNQDFDRFELLVIDDGSTDKTSKLLGEYQDPRLKVFYKPNGGVSSARNLGIQEASGEYITFVDSDDYLEQGFFKNMSQKLQDKQYDVLLYCGWMRDEQLQMLKTYHFWLEPKMHAEKETVLSGDKFFEEFCLYCGNSWACGKFFKRKIIREHQISFLHNINYAEDMMFNMCVYLHSPNILLCQERYYVCDVSTQSLSRGEVQTSEVLKNLVLIDEILCQIFPQYSLFIHKNTITHAQRWLYGGFTKLLRKVGAEDLGIVKCFVEVPRNFYTNKRDILAAEVMKKRWLPIKIRYVMIYLIHFVVFSLFYKVLALKAKISLRYRIRTFASKIKKFFKK